MNRYLLMGICMMATGCATSGVKTSAESGTSDLKSKEYEALKENVSAVHSSSYFGAEKPWLFTPQTVDTYPVEFARTHCPTASPVRSREEAFHCGKLFDSYAYSMLAEIYFAADTSEIGKKCATDPLVCGDIMAFEALFRNLHNMSIEESKREKLDLLEDWRNGKLTDEQLKAELHLDFKFEKGQFIVSLPSSIAPGYRGIAGSESE